MKQQAEIRLKRLCEQPVLENVGKVHTTHEHIIVSKGPMVKIGDVCVVGKNQIECEVIAIEKTNVYMLPFSLEERVQYGDLVYKTKERVRVPSPSLLLGSVLTGKGERLKSIHSEELFQRDKGMDVRLDGKVDAMERENIKDVFETGIKAIDGLLTIGVGQKLGIFAGPGLGKSTLLGMIAKRSQADVNVVVLVGERGREVNEFIENELGEEGLKKSVVIVATSNESPLMLLRAAKLGTSIAERFRDEGKKVLLMMDSLTRVATARRELDIASEEIPIDGKTLMMETTLKQLLERAGKTTKGSITGLYTILADGDDEEMTGAIPDIAKGILDGHILLSRKKALNNHYPAIDVLRSISRVMESVITEEHWSLANQLRKKISLYEEHEQDFKLGSLVENEETKEIFHAKRDMPHINAFLQQRKELSVSYPETVESLRELVN